jgi:RHS repeat-associated protein
VKGIRVVVAVAVVLLVLGAGMALAEQEPGAADSDPSLLPGPEIPLARTATSRTFQLEGGARETRTYTQPVNYLDAEGDWQPIENELEETGGAIMNGENSFDLRLPDQLDAGATRLTNDGEWVSSLLLGQETDAAEVSADTAAYVSSSSDVTFELTSIPTGVKEDIVLADAAQPRRFRYELDASSGLTPKLETDGNVVFRDAANEAVAILAAPTIADSSEGFVPNHDAVHYELEALPNGNWELTVKASDEWLNDPEREWPVTIDPTITVPSPSVDCDYLINGTSTTWTGCGSTGYERLQAGYYPGQSGTPRERSILKFSTSSIPKNASITKATVSLYAPWEGLNTAGIELRRVTKAWNSGMTWFQTGLEGSPEQYLWTTPGGDFTGEGAEILGQKQGWWEFNSDPLTDVVRGWVSGGTANNGVLLKQKDELNCTPPTCNSKWIAFSSSAGESSKRPYLAVVYYPPAPSTSKVTSPSEGTRTARRLKLKAGWSAAGVTGITFQFREGKTGYFQTIPTELVRKEDGKAVSWPVALSGVKESPPLYFDAAHATSTLRSKGGSLQVRAVFEGPTGVEGYSAPVEASVNRFIGGPKDATASVGPGTVDLLTGNLSVARSDVSIPVFNGSLEFSRTANSREPGNLGDTGVLGQGWKPGVPVEAGASEWKNAKKVTYSESFEGETFSYDYAVLTDLEGAELAFEKVGENYVAPPEVTGWSLVSQELGTQLVLSDPAGNKTTFKDVAGNGEYVPISVETTGEGNSARMIYSVVNGQLRLNMILGPTGGKLICNGETDGKTKDGCRSLAFSYLPATNWGAPSNYGDRLSSITYYAPGNGGPWEVAKYAYNSAGRLIEAWDPRISPNLKEAYSYETGGQLSTITPPGQEPWTMEYGIVDEEANPRLLAVKRPTLLESPSVAQTKIAYGVPIDSSGPYDLSANKVAEWGQTDIPVDATGVLPPDETSEYARATVYYMNADGEAVNTATPSGAGTSAPSITTTETDDYGNVVRELSAQNRLRALSAATEAERIAKSHDLETKRQFGESGTQMEEEWGPLHQVRIEESGATKLARLHKTVQYDAGWPGTGLKPHLPTRETTGASIQGVGGDADQRVTEIKYDWGLRKPIETIIDPSGLNIRSKTTYNKAGQVRELRQPSDLEGKGAGTIQFYYYDEEELPSKEPFNQCKVQAYSSLPCVKTYAAQPGSSLPEVLLTMYKKYNGLGQPGEVIESPGGKEVTTRKTILIYDTAGRQTERKIEGGGTALSPTKTVYSTTTGLPVEQKLNCEACDTQAVITEYDKLGRPINYTDADLNVSTTTYDLLGRPATTYDGKGTQTFTYDATSGLLTKLEDSAAGTFTAAYDADGGMTEQGLPNGLVAKTTYDEVGDPSKLTYTKTSCSEKCTWLEESNERSVYGRILSQANLGSNQQYSYDKAGRLTLTKDTPAGGGCTTRQYFFDVDSNRTKLTTRAPGIGGACDTTSTGTSQTYTYDAADRLTGEVTYDSFGRITSLPSKYAGGGSTLTTSFFSNEMVASQTQAGLTNTYQLDAVGRPRQVVQTGTKTGTEVFHYAMNGDSTAWTERGATWTRSIPGIGGNLGAIQPNSGETSLQLTNLHGDVVATASLSPSAKEPTAKFEFDEYGNPQSGTAGRFGWLGGKQRRTELPSGVIQMGVRSYVPAIGRFISVDPIQGGSANAYDYANANPVTGFDLDGMAAHTRCDFDLGYPHASSHKRGRANVVLKIQCRGNNPVVRGWVKSYLFYSPTKTGRARQVGYGKKEFSGVNFTAKASASTVCRPGWYAAVGAAFVVFSPGSIPQYGIRVFTKKRVYVGC